MANPEPKRPPWMTGVVVALSIALLFWASVTIIYSCNNRRSKRWPTSATTNSSSSLSSSSSPLRTSLSPVPADSSRATPTRLHGGSPLQTATGVNIQSPIPAASDDPLPNISIPFRFLPSAFPKAPPSDAEFEWNARSMTFEFYLNNAKVPTLKKTYKLTGKLSDVCWQVTVAKPDLPFTMRVRAVIANTQGKAHETGAARVGHPKETNVNVGVKVNPCALSDWEEANVQRIVSEGKRRAVRQ